MFLCQMQLMNSKGPAGGAVTGADRTRSSSHHGYLAEGYSSTEDSAISSEPLSRHPSNDSIDRLTPTGTNSTSKTSGMLCPVPPYNIAHSIIGYWTWDVVISPKRGDWLGTMKHSFSIGQHFVLKNERERKIQRS